MHLLKTSTFIVFIIFLGTAFSQAAKPRPGRSTPIDFLNIINLKKVYTGEVAEITITGNNISDKVVKIKNIRVSCGCTAAKPSKKTIAPGEEVKLNITINTSQKLGLVRKSLTIFYESQRIRPTKLILRVESLKHPAGHIAKSDKGIFEKNCLACHINAGEKLMGYPLYLADCAMCHGVHREGLSAPALSPKSPLSIFEMGSGNVTMPAFSDQYGGPLKKAQVDSLKKFLSAEIQINPTPQKMTNPIHRGWFLYLQVCTACHGEGRLGPIGPIINTNALKNKSHQDIEKILVEGQGSLMPSFLKSKGGLLTKEQIRDIASFLKSKPFPIDPPAPRPKMQKIGPKK